MKFYVFLYSPKYICRKESIWSTSSHELQICSFLFDSTRTLTSQFSFLAAGLVGLFSRAPWPESKTFIQENAIECFLKYEKRFPKTIKKTSSLLKSPIRDQRVRAFEPVPKLYPNSKNQVVYCNKHETLLACNTEKWYLAVPAFLFWIHKLLCNCCCDTILTILTVTIVIMVVTGCASHTLPNMAHKRIEMIHG